MMRVERLNFVQFASPAGSILVCAGPEGVCLLHIDRNDALSEADSVQLVMYHHRHCEIDETAHLALLQDVKKAILDYFDKRIPLPPIPVDLGNSSAFQQQVWKELQKIPFGETRSYLQIATSIGKPSAARAVGQACGRNPVPVIIPCHRVLAGNGKLGGFSSGLHIKKVLLELEQTGPC